MTLAMRLWIAIIFVVAAAGSASAQDTYNFYFQKKGKAVEKPAEPEPEPEEKVEEEFVEEVMEVDSDVLLVPDDWKPHQKRYKKVYVRKPKKVYVREPKTEIKAEMEEPKRKSKVGRGWQAKLGIGQVIVDNHFNTPFGGYELAQKTYVLGATYHMSKYFEVNGELHLPNGEAEADGSIFYGNYHTDPQFSIGLGATPIHLNVFGGEFLAIGVDGGVSVGNEGSLDQSSNRVYLGPRISMNFSESFSMIYAYRENISGDSDFSTSSFALAYKW